MKTKKWSILFGAIISVLACGIVSTASGATYYVATTGNDTTGNGSFDLPWKTVAKAASTMGAGDTTYIRGGTYYETVSITPTNSGNATNGYITFQNYQDETAILNGSSAGSKAVFSLAGKSYIRVIGFQIISYANGINLNSGTVSSPTANHIEVRHCYFRGTTGSPAINVQRGYDFIFADIEIDTCKNGLLVKGTANGIPGEAYNLQALDIYAHDFTASEGDGISVSNYVHDMLISGCEAHDSLDDGIDARGYNMTIENCIAYNCTYTNDSHGIKFYGIDPYDGSVPNYHGRIIKCLSFNNYQGIFLSALGHSVPPGNKPSFRSKRIDVINCTAAENSNGSIAMDDTYDNYPLLPYIHNTIATSTTDVNALYFLPNISDTNTFIPILTANYNLWWTATAGLGPINQDGTYYSSYLIENPSAPGSWFSATGNDANSRSVDPDFVDKTNNNFELQDDSVCIDAGTDVGLAYAGSAPDMGAFETGIIEVNCPANYLTTGENWISIPVAAENDEAYSVFTDLGYWPNCVYHNLYRYNSPTGSFTEYPTYQSDPVQFGKIISGGAYKLILSANQTTLTVWGAELNEVQTLTIAGTGTRNFYFGDPFNKPLYRSNCRIKNGVSEVPLNEAVSNGWVSNPEHFNPTSKSWESAGNILSPWHAYRLTAYTAGELQLVIYYPQAGDLDNDGDVDYDDLGIMGGNWLDNYCGSIPVGNLDSDCDVDLKDYAILAGNGFTGI